MIRDCLDRFSLNQTGAPVATSRPKVYTSRHSRSEQADDELRNDTNDLRGLGVREQLDVLKKLEQPAPSEREIEARPARDVASSTFARRVIKTVAALLLAIALGWMPVQRLFLVTSAEATVNARVLTLRLRRSTGKLLTGDAIPASVHRCTLARPFFALKIRAPIAGGLMNSGVTRAHWSISGRPPRNASFSLNESAQCSSHQFSAFSRFRISHIEARRDEIVADKQAATARLEASNASLQRISTLYNPYAEFRRRPATTRSCGSRRSRRRY